MGKTYEWLKGTLPCVDKDGTNPLVDKNLDPPPGGKTRIDGWHDYGGNLMIEKETWQPFYFGTKN